MQHSKGIGGVALALCLCAFAPPKPVEICTEGGGCTTVGSRSAVIVQPDYKSSAPSAAVAPQGYMGEPLDQLRRQADGGDAVAAYKLGGVYRLGLVGVTADPVAARKYLRIAADAGDNYAAADLGKMLIEKKEATPTELQDGVGYLFRASNAGQPHAMLEMGKLMFEGRLVARDANSAADLFERSAAANIPDAQYYVGQMYFRGTGRRMDGYQAIKWTREAASNGSILAQRALGQLYWAGYETVGRDRKEARKWMSAAAQQGDPDAAAFLQRVDSGEYIAGGDMARFLPAGDLILASSAVERAIAQARAALNDGRGLNGLPGVAWGAGAGSSHGGGMGHGGGTTTVVQATSGNCYQVETIVFEGGRDVKRANTVCQGPDGRYYDA